MCEQGFSVRGTLVSYTYMIRTLTGTVDEIGEGYVVVTVHDIGYLVGFPTTTNTIALHQTLTLYTHLAVRENALDLYGFMSQNELAMFELLLGVSKVGPKSALQVLNLATPKLLTEAAHKNDPLYLHKLSGIGKKTCENIVLYLHGKLDALPDTPTVNNGDLDQVQTDAIDALISLGYDAAAARNTVLELAGEETTANALVTKALKQIQ